MYHSNIASTSLIIQMCLVSSDLYLEPQNWRKKKKKGWRKLAVTISPRFSPLFHHTGIPPTISTISSRKYPTYNPLDLVYPSIRFPVTDGPNKIRTVE